MSGLLEYSGLATKLKAMGACLLGSDDYEYLINMTSYEEVIEYLKRHNSYSIVFGEKKSEGLSRISIEQLLQDTIYMDYKKIYRFASMEQKLFLQTYFVKYEVAVIKMCLSLCYGHSLEGMCPYSYTGLFEEDMSINIPLLIKSSNMDELINNLADTEYYKVLNVLKGRSDSTLYDYEILLDIYYYNNLWKSLHKKLSGNELRMMKKLYGTQIDLLNMQWIYRAKKYYNISEADIYALLIPIYYKLRKDTIKAMVKSGSISEMESIILGTVYGRLMDTKEDEWLSKAYNKMINSLMIKNIRNNPYSVACIEYYFHRKEKENERLIRIIECLRYGKEKETIRKMVYDIK